MIPGGLNAAVMADKTPPPLLARYWRWQQTGTAARTDINEIKYFTSIDGSGTNLASGQNATASSNYPGFPPSNAVDNFSNPWVMGLTPLVANNWLTVDLGASYQIRSLTLQFSQSTCDFKILCSTDDSEWVELITLNTGETGEITAQIQ